MTRGKLKSWPIRRQLHHMWPHSTSEMHLSLRVTIFTFKLGENLKIKDHIVAMSSSNKKMRPLMLISFIKFTFSFPIFFLDSFVHIYCCQGKLLTLFMLNFLNGIIYLHFLALSFIILRDIKMGT